MIWKRRKETMIKLEVSTHSGDIDIVSVEEYDPEAMAQKLNDDEVHSILIGDNIYSRIDVRNIKLIVETTE